MIDRTPLLRFGVYADLDQRYINMPDAERYEVVSEVLSGERCPHGFPDQGDGCSKCG